MVVAIDIGAERCGHVADLPKPHRFCDPCSAKTPSAAGLLTIRPADASALPALRALRIIASTLHAATRPRAELLLEISALRQHFLWSRAS
jgi:hypothetical protein